MACTRSNKMYTTSSDLYNLYFDIRSHQSECSLQSENSHWSEPNRDIQKRGLSRTSKAPLVDIKINRTGLQKFPAQRSNFSVN